MREFTIAYAQWKETADHNGFATYHVHAAADACIGLCGTREFIYRAEIDADDYAAFNSDFPSSTERTTEDEAIAAIVGLEVPQPTRNENDGRLNIVSAPMTKGMFAYWTGAGDDLSPTPPDPGRGGGTKLELDFTAEETKPATRTKIISFNSYVELYDGEGVWTEGFDNTDKFYVFILVPKNSTHCAVNATNTGNVNVVDTGQGFSIIVPAAGDGGYDMDISKGHPLPDSSGANFWQVEPYDEGGAISISVDGEGNPTGNHMFMYEYGYRIKICDHMPMGSRIGRFEVDSDKSEPIHHNWRMVAKCIKASAGAGSLGIWFKFFRPDTAELDLPETVAS